jgi:hypothetical protein
MSLAKYREVLAGLPDGASEEDIRAALAAAGMSAPEPAQPADPPQPAPTQPDPQPAGDQPQGDDGNRDASGDLDKKIAAAAKRGGVITIDASQLAQIQDGARKAAVLAKQIDEWKRDEAISDAIKSGKITAARRDHYTKLWDADPEGTKELLASLAGGGIVPVTASAYSGEGADALWEAEYRGLFPPTATGGR